MTTKKPNRTEILTEGRMRAIDVMASQVVTATPQTTVQDAAKDLTRNNRIKMG